MQDCFCGLVVSSMRLCFELFLLSYDCYSFSVIPSLGKLVADDKESYQYLVESIRRFPSQVSISLYDNMIVLDLVFNNSVVSFSWNVL